MDPNTAIIGKFCPHMDLFQTDILGRRRISLSVVFLVYYTKCLFFSVSARDYLCEDLQGLEQLHPLGLDIVQLYNQFKTSIKNFEKLHSFVYLLLLLSCTLNIAWYL